MILQELPRRITVGDTVTWDETLSDYPASAAWVVTYSFTGLDGQFASDHLAVVDEHQITIDTTALEEGRYDYTKKVADGSEVFTLEAGYIFVDPDLSADVAGVDRRTYAEVGLANIELMLAGKATKDQTSYSLNGRALSRYSITELREWRASLRTEVREQRAAIRRKSGGKSHKNIKARMSSRV